VHENATAVSELIRETMIDFAHVDDAHG